MKRVFANLKVIEALPYSERIILHILIRFLLTMIAMCTMCSGAMLVTAMLRRP